MRKLVPAFIASATILLFATPASATWSIVGVDADSGQIGVAIASCVPADAIDYSEGSQLVALVPGIGAGVTQAQVNFDARDEIEKLMAEGRRAEDVIAGTIDPSFDGDSPDRQHAVVLLNGGAAGFTGGRNSAVAYDRQGQNVSAQGNILVSRAVVDDAVAAFENDPARPLGDRLVDARRPEVSLAGTRGVVIKPPCLPTSR